MKKIQENMQEVTLTIGSECGIEIGSEVYGLGNVCVL